MTVEELLVFGKSHCHSEHAKILLAELLHKRHPEMSSSNIADTIYAILS